MLWSFRPLTGINFNDALAYIEQLEAFPSPHEDKFQLAHNIVQSCDTCFRPLTGINFNVSESVIASNFQRFPSPHGGKFQHHDGKIV